MGTTMFDNSAASTSTSALYRSPEFIALILLDDEDDYRPRIGADSDDDSDDGASSSRPPQKLLPKAMQIVKGKPRIDGVLRWVEEAGVTDTVIIAPQWQHATISSFIRQRSKPASALPPGFDEPSTPQSAKEPSRLPMRIDLHELDDEDGRHAFEVDAIREWAAKTPYKKADLIILPPSFLDTFERANVAMLPPLVTLLDKQRMDENLMTTVLLEQKKVVDNKQKKDAEPPAEPLIIIHDIKSATLLDVRELAEYEENVSLRTSLLHKFPVLSLSTLLLLSHVYVCSAHLTTVIKAHPELRHFEEQLLPWLCKAQWQKNLLGRSSRARSKRDTPLLEDEDDSTEYAHRSETLLFHSQASAFGRSSMQVPDSRNNFNARMKIACIVQR